MKPKTTSRTLAVLNVCTARLPERDGQVRSASLGHWLRKSDIETPDRCDDDKCHGIVVYAFTDCDVKPALLLVEQGLLESLRAIMRSRPPVQPSRRHNPMRRHGQCPHAICTAGSRTAHPSPMFDSFHPQGVFASLSTRLSLRWGSSRSGSATGVRLSAGFWGLLNSKTEGVR